VCRERAHTRRRCLSRILTNDRSLLSLSISLSVPLVCGSETASAYGDRGVYTTDTSSAHVDAYDTNFPPWYPCHASNHSHLPKTLHNACDDCPPSKRQTTSYMIPLVRSHSTCCCCCSFVTLPLVPRGMGRGNTAEDAWCPIGAHEWMAGGFVWTGFDVSTESATQRTIGASRHPLSRKKKGLKNGERR
jgi:hypothetical protein